MNSPFISLEPTIWLQSPLMWSLAIVLLVGVFMLARRRPDWGIASLIAAAPLYQVRGDIGPLPTTLLELWLAVVLLGILSRRRTSLQNRLAATPYFGWIVAWIGGGLIAVVAGPDLREGLGLWRAWFLEPAIWFIAAYHVFRNRSLRPILISAMVAIGIIATWSVALLLDGRAISYDNRFSGPYQSPNFLALYAAPLLALIVGWPDRSLLAYRLLVGGTGVLMMLMASSRGGQLALAAAALVCLLFLKGRLLKLAGVAVVGLAVVAAVLLGPRLLSHGDAKFPVRSELWNHATDYISEQPVFGIGPGQFQEQFTERVKTDKDRLFYVAPFAPNAHNLVLVIWTEWGLMSLVALGGLLYAFVRLVQRRLSYWQLVPVSMMAMILVHGLVDTPLLKNDLAYIFWLTLLLAAVVPVAKQRRIDRLPKAAL